MVTKGSMPFVNAQTGCLLSTYAIRVNITSFTCMNLYHTNLPDFLKILHKGETVQCQLSRLVEEELNYPPPSTV